MKATLLMCYARSGGTLISRLLGNLDDVILLSEVHPLCEEDHQKQMQHVSWQAREWYGIELKSDNYFDRLYELSDWCNKNNKKLVIREWSFVDFTPCNINMYDPSLVSKTYEGLQSRLNLRVVAFVRNAIDVYLSRTADLGEFAITYLNYCNYLKRNNIILVKYEEFCENILLVNDILGDNSLNDSELTLAKQSRVTGDIQGLSRGNMKKNPVKMKRRYAGFSERKKIDSSTVLHKSNERLEYFGGYSSVERENILNHLEFIIRRKYFRFIQAFR